MAYIIAEVDSEEAKELQKAGFKLEPIRLPLREGIIAHDAAQTFGHRLRKGERKEKAIQAARNEKDSGYRLVLIDCEATAVDLLLP